MTTKPTLLVTGGHGFVAGSVLAQAGGAWEAHALSRSKPASPQSWSWHVCAPLRGGELEEIWAKVEPDAVIHTAGIADIDFCETHQELAREVNVEFTRRVATLCAGSGARLVFCSTDTIFDGEHAPYKEEDSPGPVNLYAETKVAAEDVVRESGATGVIARLSLVIGLPVLGAGNSFLARVLTNLKNGRTVIVPEQEVRTPIDVISLGQALLELAQPGHEGIFHLAGLSQVNRLELTRKFARTFALPEHLVQPQAAASIAGRAPRPRDVSLDSSKACAQLKTPMLTLEQALARIHESSSTL